MGGKYEVRYYTSDRRGDYDSVYVHSFIAFIKVLIKQHGKLIYAKIQF